MHRWTLFGDGSVGKRLTAGSPIKVMVHHFLPDADDRDAHDHPRGFLTIVLWGGYDDYVPCEACGGGELDGCLWCAGTGLRLGDRLRAGSIRYRHAEYAHRTRVGPRGAWTLCVMGPFRREWGFWRLGRWVPFLDYEERFGPGMRCE